MPNTITRTQLRRLIVARAGRLGLPVRTVERLTHQTGYLYLAPRREVVRREDGWHLVEHALAVAA